jgi:alpha-N-acetylglucosamine transferase
MHIISYTLWRQPRRLQGLLASAFIFGLVAIWYFLSLLSSPIRDPSFGVLDRPLEPRYAIATFLTGDPASQDDEDDDYFIATRVLTYQLLHANETRCHDPTIPFEVIVTSTVSQKKIDQLISDGAIVRRVEDIPLRWWIKTGVTRWADQFTKLRLFEMTQYDRILFIDADTLITRPVDAIFDEPSIRAPYSALLNRKKAVKSDEIGVLPAEYVFAARSDNALTGERDHPFPPLPTNVFSAGFWVAAPSLDMFQYLLSVMNHYRRFDPHTMEQSLLNYAFRRDASMPWIELDYQWSATWPNEKDVEGNVATLHEKFWSTGPDELQGKWQHARRRMEAYYDTEK